MGDPASVPGPSLLDGFAMFEGVAAEPRQALLASAGHRDLPKGEVLLRENGANDYVYLILAGELGVFLAGTGKEPVATLGAGESVGEMSLLDGSPASASVVATTPCRLLAIDEATFWELIESSHAFAISLLVKLTRRLRANNATVSQSVILRRRFERAAMFDGLTGIHNRRWLDETLHRLVGRVQGHEKGSLTIALIDIDHFKAFNDRFGHEAGDEVLTTVAQVLSRNLRPTDLVARFGGEEFVILFPDTDLQLATIAAERVREAVASEALVSAGRTLPPVTISMGVAQYAGGQTVPQVLKAADRAMYEATALAPTTVTIGHPTKGPSYQVLQFPSRDSHYSLKTQAFDRMDDIASEAILSCSGRDLITTYANLVPTHSAQQQEDSQAWSRYFRHWFHHPSTLKAVAWCFMLSIHSKDSQFCLETNAYIFS